jgi:hypothetical protein
MKPLSNHSVSGSLHKDPNAGVGVKSKLVLPHAYCLWSFKALVTFA